MKVKTFRRLIMDNDKAEASNRKVKWPRVEGPDQDGKESYMDTFGSTTTKSKIAAVKSEHMVVVE